MNGDSLLLVVLVIAQIIFALLLVLLYRQVTMISLRVGLVRGPEPDPVLVIGKPLPEEAARELSLGRSELSYVLWLTTSCAGCRRAAQELQQARGRGVHLAGELITLVTGDASTSPIVGQVSAVGRIVLDPAATRVVEALALDTSPFMIEVSRGVITGWVVPESLDDIVRLQEARKDSDASEWADRAAEPVKLIETAVFENQ